MPPPGYPGADRPQVPSASQAHPQRRATVERGLMQSKHRSIFLAGGAVANVDGIVDASNGRGEGGGGVNKGVVDQMLDHERQVEVILGARLSAKTSGAFEYLVKWVRSVPHSQQVDDGDPLDQTAPAKFGEYILQYGRVPRMLADERWSKPQRIVAVA